MNRKVQIMTSDNKPIVADITDIDKAEKSKYHKYQDSGVNPDIQSEINIKDTPFDLDRDK